MTDVVHASRVRRNETCKRPSGSVSCIRPGPARSC
jgi:hypothetical protein